MEIKKRILVVEDEQKIRGALNDFLEFRGFDVFVAVDGADALEKAANGKADLILLDLMLPKISGEDLCKQWRQKGMQTPIIMLTAKDRKKKRLQALISERTITLSNHFLLRSFWLE